MLLAHTSRQFPNVYLPGCYSNMPQVSQPRSMCAMPAFASSLLAFDVLPLVSWFSSTGDVSLPSTFTLAVGEETVTGRGLLWLMPLRRPWQGKSTATRPMRALHVCFLHGCSWLLLSLAPTAQIIGVSSPVSTVQYLTTVSPHAAICQPLPSPPQRSTLRPDVHVPARICLASLSRPIIEPKTASMSMSKSEGRNLPLFSTR